MFRYLILVMITVFLTGCASSTKENDGKAYIYNIPAGSQFILKKSINIPSRSAHVNLQDGQPVKYSHMEKYAPNCRFEVNTRGEQTINPGTFQVTKVKRSTIRVSRDILNYVVKFELTTSDPNIRSLTCGVWSDRASGYYLTVPQMQQAIGDYFETPTL